MSRNDVIKPGHFKLAGKSRPSQNEDVDTLDQGALRRGEGQRARGHRQARPGRQSPQEIARQGGQIAAPARRTAGALFAEIGRTLDVYIRAQILISLILTAVCTAGFALLGLPFWFLVAPLCGLLNFIPRFGGLIGLLIGVLVGLLGGFGLLRVAELMAVYLVAFTLEGFWLTPWLLGRRLRLRPLCVFVALLAGGALFGFLGLLVAVPALAVALVVYRFFAANGNSGIAASRKP